MKVEIENGSHLGKDQLAHMCKDKKNSFKSKKVARRFLKMVNDNRQGTNLPKLSLYKCRLCGNYHFTKRSSKRKYKER